MRAFPILLLLFASALLFGCTETNGFSGIPPTFSTVWNAITDASLSQVRNGDYNGKILYMDWNKIGFTTITSGGGGGGSSLLLDQTTPQTVSGGAPIFDGGLEVGTTGSIGTSGTANATIDNTGNIKANSLQLGTNTDPPRGIFDVDTLVSESIEDVTGDTTLYFEYGSGVYDAYGYAYTFSVYAYKTVGADRVYSTNPLVISGSDDEGYNYYYMYAGWDPVSDPAVEGYRVIVTDPICGVYDDYYFDTPNTYFDIGMSNACYDEDYGVWYDSGNTVTPKNISSGANFYIDSADGTAYYKGTPLPSFDQSLNTTNDVIFNKVNATTFMGAGSGATTWTTLFGQQGAGRFTAPLKIGGMEIGKDAGQGDSITYMIQRTNGFSKSYGSIMSFYSNAANGKSAITLAFDGDYWPTIGWEKNFMAGSAGAYLSGSIKWKLDNNTGRISAGHGTPLAQMHAISTTEQLRLGYDGSNYFSTTVGSTGTTTFDAIGSGAKFVFSDDVNLSKKLDVNETSRFRQDANFNKNIYQDGNYFGNQIYGEDWNKLDSGFETVDLVTNDVYVRVKKLGAGSLNGFTVSDGNLIAQYAGMYLLNAKASVSVGVGGEDGMKAFVNDTGQNNCYSHQHLTNKPSDMVITCLVRLTVGQNVNIRFDDHANPVSDIIIDAMNVNLTRVGN